MNVIKPLTQNRIQETQVCPICKTNNSKNEVHCTTCAWSFQLQNTAQYALEWSRAKQQYQIITALKQVTTTIQIQNKILENISARLEVLENTVQKSKNKPNIQTLKDIKQTNSPKHRSLIGLKTADNFDTSEKRQTWWHELEEQWQKAFNEGFLGKEALSDMPTDEDLQAIFESPSLHFVGPNGMYPNLSFELTNLSGIKHLTNLTTLVLTDHAITNLGGIEKLYQLVSLFVQNNQLTTITAVQYLPQLKQLYCQSNALTSIAAIEQLTKLNTLFCNYNLIEDFRGITQQHAEKLTSFYALPNDKIKPNEIRRVKDLGIFCRKG